MKVECIVSSLFHENMYILRKDSCKEVIVIDPGEPQEEKLLACFRERDIYPVGVILTHEHFDHCAGVNILEKYYNFELFASRICCENIKNFRKNLSLYAADFCDPFQILHSAYIIDDMQKMSLCEIPLQFIWTPGHSQGSICIILEDILFSGDTILESKVPVKLPGSDSGQLKDSIIKLKLCCKELIKVYPGHGNSFVLDKSKSPT